ncbi:hypothetical protein OAA15_00810 [bacterium]|nr:hypothetical protein [bacterium]
MKTIAQLLKHDFKKGSLSLYDSNGKLIYYEHSDGYWEKKEFDSNGNKIYFENSDGTWIKREYDSNGNRIYFENSNGHREKREYNSNGRLIYFENSDGKIMKHRPKSSCEGKVVEIDGKKYQLKEVD